MLETAGYRMPAEWEPHRACWLAWPCQEDLWGEDLDGVRREFVGLCRAIGGEKVEVLVFDEAGQRQARRELAGVDADFHRAAYGDVWLRDTGPSFLVDAGGGLAGLCFRFNGWGEKYLFESDDTVGVRVTVLAGAAVLEAGGMVVEGGALEVDGQGTCLTTRSCLLNHNRNPQMDEEGAGAFLCEALGVEKVLWLERGLDSDHTDGHVDTLARFSQPGRVVCMRAGNAGDPGCEVFAEVEKTLSAATDAGGRRLEVVTLPSPGAVNGQDGSLLPASYLNFYISNSSVVIPVYGSVHDREAVDTIASLFPGREAVALEARLLLGGGGAFHCITQQEPA
ncbi:MAG: agmatine deiminase family protein [Deltaproteobacteria bacterium]